MMCVTVGRVTAGLSVLLGYVYMVEESNIKLMKLVGENSIFCDSRCGGFTRKDKINIAWENIGKGPHASGKVNYC
jgi:hypothetical protein